MDHESNGNDLPVALRIGSVGPGIGVGCGLGIGFGKPLNLGDVPAIGQAVSGMSTGLGQVNGVLGGAGSSVRELVRRTGVKGLDAGLGCGVGVGYGFGAGLFLKPSATEYLVQLVKDVTGELARKAQQKLQEVGIQLPTNVPELGPNPFRSQPRPLSDGLGANTQPPLQQASLFPTNVLEASSNSSNGNGHGFSNPAQSSYAELPGAGSLEPSAAAISHLHRNPVHQPRAPALDPVQQTHGMQLTQQVGMEAGKWPRDAVQRDVGTARPSQDPFAAPSSAEPAASHSGAGLRGSAVDPSAEEFRTLLRHEREIARLRAQNRALRGAVCNINSRLPLCKGTNIVDTEESSHSW